MCIRDRKYLTDTISTPGELQKELYKYIDDKQSLTSDFLEKVKPFLNQQLENFFKGEIKYDIEQILELQLNNEITRLEQESSNFTEEYKKQQQTKEDIDKEIKETKDSSKKKTLEKKLIDIDKTSLELTKH